MQVEGSSWSLLQGGWCHVPRPGRQLSHSICAWRK
jgi:hypothetical protein